MKFKKVHIANRWLPLQLDKELKKEEQDDSKLFTDIFKRVVKTLYVKGQISLDDFKDIDGFKKKFLSINERAKYEIVIDHSEDLIDTARDFKGKQEYQKAKLFYATFFEHELNGLIIQVCDRMKIQPKIANDIIKSVNMIGKLTWLPTILKIPVVSEKHKNIILKLADDRNAFVHYKHNPEPDEPSDYDSIMTAEFIKIEKSVTYFKKYIAKILFKGEKGKLEKKLKGKP